MSKFTSYIFLISCFVLYACFGFIPRSNTLILFSYFALLFGAYFYFFRTKDFTEKDLTNTLRLGLLYRVACLFWLPNLSDDYFRFLWDGIVSHASINPFNYTPTEAADQIKLWHHWILPNLNSEHYYSVYPPVNQAIFYIATYFNTNVAVIVMKLFILAAEYGTVKLLISLLKRRNMSPMKAMLYFLNPLVIIELTGNLHFEAIMIFFLVLAIYLLVTKRAYLAGVACGLAVLTKVIPLLFLPFFIKRLGWKKNLQFFSVIGITVIGISAFYFNLTQLHNFYTSIQLYFGNFQFNASIYQWLRSLGQLFLSGEVMSKLSSFLSIVVIIIIVVWVFKEKKAEMSNLFSTLLLALTLHLSLATTVHPWYITTGVALAVFTNYRYILVWSALAVLSYATYINEPIYQELFWVNAIEYIIVWGLFIFEYKKIKAISQ